MPFQHRKAFSSRLLHYNILWKIVWRWIDYIRSSFGDKKFYILTLLKNTELKEGSKFKLPVEVATAPLYLGYTIKVTINGLRLCTGMVRKILRFQGRKNIQKQATLVPPRNKACLVGFANSWKLSNISYNIWIHHWKQIGGAWAHNRCVLSLGKFKIALLCTYYQAYHWSKSFVCTGKYFWNVLFA